MMTGFKTLMLAIGVVLAALAAGLASAQSPSDPAGTWHGTLASKHNDVTLILYVTRGADGMLSAEIESRDQAPGRKRPVSDFASANGRMSFKVGSGATYDGSWNEAKQQWRGNWSQGSAVPLNFTRGAPPPKPRIDGLDGTWEGMVELNGAKLRQVLRFASGEWGTNGAYDSPDQLVSGVVLTNLVRDGRAVRFAAFHGDGKFTGELSDDGARLTGTWRFPGQPDLLTLFTLSPVGAVRAEPLRPQTPVGPFPYKVEDVAFDNPGAPGVRLSGSLTLPEGKGPFPAVILISGSSGQDRDEAMAGHRPFAVIADHLTRRGIAVLRFDDGANNTGTIGYGGVEWMRAGRGVWHGKELGAGRSKGIEGFQLWLALPADLELADAESQYLEAGAIPEVGPARLIIGRYDRRESPVPAPADVNYLMVTLKPGETWRYETPAGHTAGWLAVSNGEVMLDAPVSAGEMVIFDNSDSSIEMRSTGDVDAKLVIGSAAPHPHPLHLGNYSVHTSADALKAGERHIMDLRKKLIERERQRLPSTSGPVPVLR